MKDQKEQRQNTPHTHAERARERLQKEHYDEHFKIACLQWQDELVKEEAAKADNFKYKKVSAETICSRILKEHGIAVKARTVRDCVKRGDAGKPLGSHGPKGRIPEQYYEALLRAVESYASMTQELGTTTVTRPRLVRIVNIVVNKKEGAGSRTGRKLFDRIEKDLAGILDIGKPNRI